jgi:hypothetical protein
MRRSLRTIGVVTLGLAASALAATAVAGPSAAASTSAKTEYLAALRAAGTESVHYVSKATEGSDVLEVIGDTGKNSGSQVLAAQEGSSTEELEIVLIGATGYLRGNATSLQGIIGLTAAQSKTYTNVWLSFPSNNATMGALVAGLRDKGVSSELAMTGPYTSKGNKKIDGRNTRGVGGFGSESSGTKVPLVLYFNASGTPYPVEEVTNPNGKSTAIRGTIVFTKWGEKTHPKAPAKSVALASLAASG